MHTSPLLRVSAGNRLTWVRRVVILGGWQVHVPRPGVSPMLFVLTALAILPDDLASREADQIRNRISRQVAVIDEAIADYRVQIEKTRLHLYQYGTSEENWNYLSDMLAMYQARLDTRLMHRDMAERAELRGPPFAAAVWRVKPAGGK